MAGKYAVKYYSDSKRAEVEIDEMHSSHLLAAWRKAQRAGAWFPKEVFEALAAEVKERGLDKPKEEFRL